MPIWEHISKKEGYSYRILVPRTNTIFTDRTIDLPDATLHALELDNEYLTYKVRRFSKMEEFKDASWLSFKELQGCLDQRELRLINLIVALANAE